MAEITVKRSSNTQFRVTVQDTESQTIHEVTATSSDLQRYGGESSSPERLIKASFEFLLEREPKESIFRSFALPVIEQYFPEYPREIGKLLR